MLPLSFVAEDRTVVEPTDSVWIDGRFVPFPEATVPFFSHTLHYGLGVFEGIRCYRQDGGGSAVFRLREHVRRLFDSAHMCLIEIPFEPAQIERACLEVVARNRLEECYIRPLVWLGEGSMGLGSTSNPVRVGVGAFPWGAYLGEEGIAKGVRCCVSSLQRLSQARHFVQGKVVGQYVNSVLANRAARLAGYDEAILLDERGLVAEGPGENVFLVRDGTLRTPPLSSPILPGITRDSVLTLAREHADRLGIRVIEEPFPREALYCADEVFLVGTAAEVTPVREVDGRTVGNGEPGPVTRELSRLYQDVARGREELHADWRVPVPESD